MRGRRSARVLRYAGAALGFCFLVFLRRDSFFVAIRVRRDTLSRPLARLARGGVWARVVCLHSLRVSLDARHTRFTCEVCPARLHTHRGSASGTWLLRPGTPSPETRLSPRCRGEREKHNGTARAVQQVLRPFLALDAPLPPGSTRPQPPPPPRSLALSSARATYRET